METPETTRKRHICIVTHGHGHGHGNCEFIWLWPSGSVGSVRDDGLAMAGSDSVGVVRDDGSIHEEDGKIVCAYCNIVLNGLTQWEAHVVGKMHRNRGASTPVTFGASTPARNQGGGAGQASRPHREEGEGARGQARAEGAPLLESPDGRIWLAEVQAGTED